MKSKRSTYTRRSALCLLASAGTALTFASPAWADTTSDLQSAQARLSEAQAELDAIASEYEALSIEQSKTLDQIEKLNSEIQTLEKRIAKLEKQLTSKQKELSKAVSEEYKDGSRGVVDLLVRSESVENLISNLYCYEKITEEQAALIQDVKDTRESYLNDKAELEAQQVELEAVSRTQQEQLDAMRNKQLEAQQVIDGLDKEVKDLIAKRDAELLAAQQEAERARKAREEAEQAAAAAEAAAAQESSASSSAESTESSSSTEAEKEEEEDSSYVSASAGTGSAAAVVASCHSTPSPGGGLCAGWCSNVMINAGYGFVAGNANDMYAEFCHSSNRADLKTGMAVAVSTHPHTSAGRIYGHIGMYIGGGTMMDNIGYIRTISVDEWCAYYGETVSPRWGWLNNIELT